jgi:hypothetical protein
LNRCIDALEGGNGETKHVNWPKHEEFAGWAKMGQIWDNLMKMAEAHIS